MKGAKQALALMVLAVTVGCSNQFLSETPPPPVAEALTVYHTSDTARLFDGIANSSFEANHHIEFDFQSGNHVALLNQLENNQIPYFVTHHNETDASNTLWSAPLVQDGLAIIVHPSNPVHNLDIEQIQRIYRGFITTWDVVGGTNDEIVLYSREDGAGIRMEFERLVMGQQQTSPNAQVLSSSALIIQQITIDPNGIGYVPISLLTNEQNPIAIDTILPSLTTIEDNSYPLKSTIFVVGLQQPDNKYLVLFTQLQNTPADQLLGRYVPLPR